MKCENCYFGGVTIGSKGHKDAPFVIVGESPGALELAQGKPFVGPSGELLHDTMKEFNDCFPFEPLVLNAINCMPRKKDPKKLSAACKACAPRLEATIREYPRKVILALGNGALWSLTGNHTYKITKERGKVFKSPLASEGIVATVHPSFLLRGGGNMQQFRRDIAHAVSLFVGEELKTNSKKRAVITRSGTFTPSAYRVLETPEEVDKLARKLKTVSVYACDTETHNFSPLAPYHGIPQYKSNLLCAGFCYKKDFTYVVPGHLLTDALFDNDAIQVWHNGKYDMKWLRAFGMKSARVDGDTMLLSYLLNEKGGIHDLEQVGADWLNAPNYKDMLDQHLPNKKSSYATIPPKVLWEYQAVDANLTFCAHEPMMQAVFSDARLRRVYEEILIPASEWLFTMERNGFAVDPEQVEHNRQMLQTFAEEVEAEFNSYAIPVMGSELNIRSWQQVDAFIYGKLKLGKPGSGTDAKTLEKLPDHPAILALRKHRKVAKLLGTYVKGVGLKVENGRMHSTFKLHGTTTGRLSSNKPNMQNQPRNKAIRGQFWAPAGRAILAVDLSQAELRMLACLSNDKAMIEIFRSGLSLHDEVATALFGTGFNKEQKMIAKNINFGIIYGISAHGLKDQVNDGARLLGSSTQVTNREAQEWIDGWAARFPEAWNYIQRCRSCPQRGVTLISAFGRKRRFQIVSAEKLREMQNEAANFPHQSGAHDITMISGTRTYKYLESEYSVLNVNEVHDELTNEVPDDMRIIVRVARHLSDTLQQVPKEWKLTAVPFVAEAEVGYRWENGVKFNPHDQKWDEYANATFELGNYNEEYSIGKVLGCTREIIGGVLAAVEAME